MQQDFIPGDFDIAIIGMAGRFPGAANLDEFWLNLAHGVESVATFTEEEVLAEGVNPALARDPHYVKAGGVLEGAELFDARFFGFYPREAEIMDPQHRVFLELAWAALEHAGYDPATYPQRIGLYAGTGMNSYLLFNLFESREIRETVQGYQITIANDKDFLPTRVSYKLNLRGPSINVQTACSTSLVATHLACQALLNYQCEMALAGGVTIRLPQKNGYLYQEGGIASPDGHCRAFDADAAGTVGGNGAGIVVLKRLADALADHDTIHAVIRGTALNNDGSAKVGYTAPSVDGQVDVITSAQVIANVDPRTISYIETHGTGTALGDPIEMTALTQVFRQSTPDRQFCAIGSLKTNIGHLDAAAGVASLIKTTLALEHAQIPPSLNYHRPNPRIDFASSPFYVNTELADWAPESGIRRAAVSSFGIGGTNAHAILEAAPQPAPSGPSRGWQLLTLSARSDEALNTATKNLAAHLAAVRHGDYTQTADLADVAYTLKVGRQPFAHRRVALVKDVAGAVAALNDEHSAQVLANSGSAGMRSVAFMFTGQGSQYPDMAAGLYRSEPVFRGQVDRCAELLRPHLGLDLRTLLFPSLFGGAADDAAERLKQTAITQPALFVVEYALAQLWMAWGVRPDALIGHSIGEYVAACLAGVFSLPDALAVVAARGRLMGGLPGGSMLSVPLAEADLRLRLREPNGVGLALAAVNAPALCVVAGPHEAVDRFERGLKAEGVAARRLRTSHAFHSAMMDPILSPFVDVMRRVRLDRPTLPYISNVTGTWITADHATDPAYYAQHLRQTVRFADGIAALAQEPARGLLEVGPGRTLASLASSHPATGRERAVVASLPGPQGTRGAADAELAADDQAFTLMALGRLWLAGITPDWDPVEGRAGQPWAAFYADETRGRVPLPTYPFERQRYWVEPTHDRDGATPAVGAAGPEQRREMADWFYVPLWQQTPLLPRVAPQSAEAEPPRHWLVLAQGGELENCVLEALADSGAARVTRVIPGTRFAAEDEGCYQVRPGNTSDYEQLFSVLAAESARPAAILHLWNAPSPSIASYTGDSLEHASALGFDSLLALARGWSAEAGTTPLRITVVATGLYDVMDDKPLAANRAPILGACRVIPQEYPAITCQVIDVQPGREPMRGMLGRQVVAELLNPPAEAVVAYRAGRRWVQTFERTQAAHELAVPLRERGAYLITGGLGRIGLVLAEHLAQGYRGRLALVDRAGLPARAEWDAILAERDETDPTCRKLRQIRRLEGLGSEVLIVQADVADPAQMAAAVAQVVEKFGPLNGVIHAAGTVGAAAIKAVAETGAAERDAQFAPKIRGTLALADALGERPLDFVLLMSSISTVLGGLGFAAYAGANAYLDAFAAQQAHVRPQQHWLSVAWDGWEFPEEGALGRSQQARATTSVNYSLAPAEGAAAFARVLGLEGLPNVIVSTGDLAARRARWTGKASDAARVADEQAAASGADAHATGPKHYARPNLRTPYAAAADDIETTMVADWENILGIAPIGVNDDFFELGGHSLLATQLVSRLRDAYHVDLPLRNLFETPTVAGLAALIRTAQAAAVATATGEPASASRDAIQRASRRTDTEGFSLLPLSYGQQRLWFLDQLDPGSPLYNNFAALRLTADPAQGADAIHAGGLEAALNEIVRRHEVLRTIFAERNGEPVQKILSEMPVTVALTDLSALAPAAAEAEVLRLALDEARAPFDLAAGPLFRAHLLRTAAHEHVLFFTMHHIVSDGWSVGVLLHEVTALLAAEGIQAALPELPIQYADYAAWQRAWLTGTPRIDDAPASNLQAQLGYWRERLAGGPAPLELSTDRPRPTVQTSAGANHWFTLPADLYERLEALARNEGATLFMALLAGLDVLLYRYTGQEDFAVGTPVANRDRIETQPLIGFLLNTLVLRAPLAHGPSFRELLRRVREAALGAYAHQDVPFEMLVETLQPERDMSRSPFFQVMFDLQAAPLKDLALPGVTLTRLDVDGGTAKFDLALSMEYAPGQLGGYLNYNRDLFDPETIARMIHHFRALLEAAVAEPDVPIAHLPMLSAAEEHALLVEWNAGPAPAGPVNSGGGSVLDMFSAQVSARPDAIAAMLALDVDPAAHPPAGLTYAELNARAEQLAAALITHGAGPERIVALLVERSLDMVTAIVGTLMAGAAFLPIDPTYPAERIRFMLEDSAACAVLTDDGRRMTDNVWSEKVGNLWLHPTGSAASPASVVPQPSSDALAYVIYTSGSTGQPKGVLIEAGDLAQHLRDVSATFGLQAGDRILQFAAYTFDQGIEQILTSLTVGGTLIVRGPEIWPPADFPQVIANYGLNSVNLPPAYWNQVVQEWMKTQTPIPADQLRSVISGGDVLTAESLRLWQSTPARTARLLNAYGPTETTVTALVFDVPADWFEGGPGRAGRPVPIGRPLAGRVAYIVDRDGNPVPDGVPGELLLGGTGVARGYLARPALTAERFARMQDIRLKIEDSGSLLDQNAQSAKRLYRTGDFVRRRRDGWVEFLGRVDQQVKIRGFRIELGEIEAALIGQPGVQQAVVVARADAGGTKQLVAYVVPVEGGQNVTPAELRAALAQQLPAYMIPAAFVRLDRVPLTSSGKVDRHALPAPDASALAAAGAYIAPRTPTEQDIAAVWAEVLGVGQVGALDNFFDLGGHSLLATQILSRLRSRYPVALPLRRLFETPTVAGLAEAIEEALMTQQSDDELAKLLAELEGLSDEEAGRLLADGEAGG